ncbi:NIF3-like protein 1 isoform X2 [Lineus longissimus]
MSLERKSSQLRSNTTGTNRLDLKEVVKRIEAKAPTFLAESWDNVGLLVEPSSPHDVGKILLTNDLTEPVLEEAIREKADVIFSYHPPIFTPLKRLTQKAVKERIIVKCIENRIAVYSPHTVYDALEDGVNYWLAQAFEKHGITNKCPISGKHYNSHLCRGSQRLEVTVPNHSAEEMRKQLASVCCSDVEMSTKSTDGTAVRLSYNVTQEGLTKAVQFLQDGGSDLASKTEVIQLQKPPYPGAGIGLIFDVNQPISLEEAVTHVKQHIGVERVRLSIGNGCTMASPIKSVACCAGSGSSVLRGTGADLYLTGEMSHHELLDATSQGTNVILCEHSNSERGFLKTLLKRFSEDFSDVKMDIVVSCMDVDPVTIV